MIPVATILSAVGSITKGVMEWLNSAAGNMFKGWVKGRKDQQRIDTIKQHEREGGEVSRIAERLQEHDDAVAKERFESPDHPRDPHFRGLRSDRPRWRQDR